MDVSIEGQTRRIAHAVPLPRTGAPVSPRAAASAAGQPQPELFDANGDGVIENWSIAHGGDSFANFDPPPSGATSPVATKTHRGSAGPGSAMPAGVRPDVDKGGHATTEAAMRHAHDAYQRDGVGGAPVAEPAHDAPASASASAPDSPGPAAPAPSAVPMPVPTAPGPLRSSPP